MRIVGFKVGVQEFASLRARGHDGVVAMQAAPFGKVVRNVEGWRRGRRVFVVDEGDAYFFAICRGDDDVAGEEIAVGKGQL